MILNITPIDDANKDCYEKVIDTVSAYFGRSCGLMYLNSCNFTFIQKNEEEPYLDIGSRMCVGSNNKLELFNKYHGIEISFNSGVTSQEVITIANEYLSKGIPLIVESDSFWVPWNGFYQRDNFTHYYIIVGVDSENNEFICTDPRRTATPHLRLSYEEFIKGFISVGFISLNDEMKLTPTEIQSLILAQLYQYINSFAFESMRKFAYELSQLKSFKEEIDETLDESPLYNNLKLIAKGRSNYSTLLKHINEQLGGILSVIPEKMLKIGQGWESIRGVWSKMYLKGRLDEIVVTRMVNKIQFLANQEEELMYELISILENNNDITKEKSENLQAPTEITNALYEYIDLNDYVNNCGFGGFESNADFDGTQLYFIKENHSKDELVICDEFQFRFTKQEYTNYDNISCYGEVIEVPPKKYRGLMVLGCSENGTFFDNMIIEYSDGSQIELQISLSDWWYVNPGKGEKIAWEGKLAQRTPNGVELYSNLVRLFSKSIHIQSIETEIVRIHLPLCPNLHIFGLTMII